MWQAANQLHLERELAIVRKMTDASDSLFGGRLTIDLKAIAANWTFLKNTLSDRTECAATVKADAYGTGLTQSTKALYEMGCRTFFVALPVEALKLCRGLPDATIYVLDGLFPGTAETLAEKRIRPVLASLEEVQEWVAFCRETDQHHPAALHVDTGIHRLGLSAAEFEEVMLNGDIRDVFTPSLIMSHLACGADPEHPMNAAQLKRFKTLTAAYSDIPKSLANSAGVFLGEDYHFDLVRPGISLYGGKALDTMPNPMQPVVKVEARIMMVRSVPKGDTIGYGAMQTARRDLRVAVVAAGYADGMMRRAGSTDIALGAYAMIEGRQAPLLGRISMDMITLDVTDIPPHLTSRGAFVEMMGPQVAASDLAAYADTIDYEYLTNLGRRFHRRYASLT